MNTLGYHGKWTRGYVCGQVNDAGKNKWKTVGMSGYERMYDGVSRYDKNDKRKIKRKAHAQHPILLVHPPLADSCPCPLPLPITSPAPVPCCLTCPFPLFSFFPMVSFPCLPSSVPISPTYPCPLASPYYVCLSPLFLPFIAPVPLLLPFSPTPSAPCRHASARPPHQPPVNCI